MESNDKTHCIPFMFDPSFTSTNAKVFCFRTVLTHPLMSTGVPSVACFASIAFTLRRTLESVDADDGLLVDICKDVLDRCHPAGPLLQKSELPLLE